MKELRMCSIHGETIYAKYSEGEGKSSYSCLKCRADSHRKTFANKKQKAVDYLGGECSKCGYNKCNAALEFHHLDPNEKDVEPSRLLRRSWDKVKIEIDKCILVCSNCHREIHAGINKV